MINFDEIPEMTYININCEWLTKHNKGSYDVQVFPNCFLANYIKTLQEKIPLLPDEATAYEEEYKICDALKERVKTSTKNTCVMLYHDIREKINE